MSSLFNKRKLSSLYSNIDAVKESSAIKTADGYLKLKVGMGFGEHGRMTRHKSIKLSATDMLSVTRAVKEHESSILDVIDMLEDALKWINACHTRAVRNGFDIPGELNEHQQFLTERPDIFNRVLAEEAPLMVHGVSKGRRMKLQFFCAGLKGMELMYNVSNEEQVRMLKARLDEMISTFRNHLIDVDKLNYTAIMEGVAQ